MSCDFHEECGFPANYTCSADCDIKICWAVINELDLAPNYNDIYKCRGDHYQCSQCKNWNFNGKDENSICWSCKKKICAACLIWCEGCQKEICYSCSEECVNCSAKFLDNNFCKSCLDDCHSCSEGLCQKHAKYCGECDVLLCKKCKKMCHCIVSKKRKR